MELKVWVEGIQRIVCGVTETTTCQVSNVYLNITIVLDDAIFIILNTEFYTLII